MLPARTRPLYVTLIFVTLFCFQMLLVPKPVEAADAITDQQVINWLQTTKGIVGSVETLTELLGEDSSLGSEVLPWFKVFKHFMSVAEVVEGLRTRNYRSVAEIAAKYTLELTFGKTLVGGDK